MNLRFPPLRPLSSGVIFTCLVLTLSACEKPAAPSSKSDANVVQLGQGDVAQAVVQTLNSRVEVTGSLEALKQTQINAVIDAEISDVLVRPGMTVKQGDVLVRFSTTDVQLRVNQQKAQLDSAKAQLQVAESSFNQQKALLQDKFISKNAYDNSATNLANAQAQVKVAEAQLALAQQQVNDAVARAPFSGVIADRMVEPGQRVAPHTPLLKLVDNHELELSAAIANQDVGRVQVGQAVQLTVEGFENQPVSGEVVRVAPAADGVSRRIPVFIRVANVNGQLRSGLFAHGSITTKTEAASLSIPVAAIHQSANQSSWVWLVQNNRLVRRPVVTALRDEAAQRVAISSGLAANDWVLTVPGNEFIEGQAIALPAQKP